MGFRITQFWVNVPLRTRSVCVNVGGNANAGKNSSKMLVFFSKGYFVVWPCVPRIPFVAAAAAGYTPSYPSEGQGDCAGCHSNRLSVPHDDSPGHLATKHRNTTHYEK